ncbi:hypothetical protein MUK42_29022 [Musa troglodytarum]|uniref:Glycine-rich protein n=1 Tax=Musa troglodytarum TaxID=320322 RepID=A0A9E7JZV3_9LILI|nr:hypothetical protein MUK42_29022 [Musa troglodytarum]
MASSGMEATVDGPVQSLMNKRLRALRKKYNRILQMEESLAQGKPLNKEQEEVLRSKPAITVLIDEYEKLRQPLAVAIQEELARAAAAFPPPPPALQEEPTAAPTADDDKEELGPAVEDLLTLLYFGCLFDVKPQSEFAATMLTRTHERGCCLTYDYVTDDATDLLGEQDLDAISALGSLVTSRPVYSGISHKNALQVCLQHAKLWLLNADQPIHPGSSVTYAGLREKLDKILASDYFTTTPEMKAPGDVAAAVGKYGAACQVQISESTTMPSPMVQTEDSSVPVGYQHKHLDLHCTINGTKIRFGEEEKTVVIRAKALLAMCGEVAVFSEVRSGSCGGVLEKLRSRWHACVYVVNNLLNGVITFKEDEQQEFQEKEAHPDNEDNLVDESLKVDEPDTGSPADAASDQQDQQKLEVEMEEQNLRDTETKEQHNPRRSYHNQRGATRSGGGGSGGRRGYANGRGGRGGGGGYQNGRSQYYDSGYYPRNYYNARGRGGRSSGSAVYTNHGGHTSANVELDTSA